MAKNANYDCQLEWGSTVLPLMLMEEGKLKKYLSYYAPPLGQSIQTGEASALNFPPEQELVITQNEFHAGMGALNYYNKRYAFSNGVDARTRAIVKLAPKENTATITPITALTTAAYSNMGFETWTDATTLPSWTKTGTAAVATNRSTDKSAGTYACNLEQYFSDDFSSDNWTDTGTKIVVSGGVIAFESENSATDTRTSKDMTSMPAVWNWKLDLNVTTATAGGVVVIGSFATAENFNGMAGDAILLTLSYSDATHFKVRLYAYNGGVLDGLSTEIDGFSFATPYYITIQRTSDTAATLNIYSDAARTTHVAGSPQSIVITASAVTGLRYLNVTNNNSGAGAAQEIIGTIDNMEFRGSSVAGDMTLYQGLSTWSDVYENKSATFTCYAKTALASNLRIGIYDGVTTSYSSYHTGGGAYENLTVTYTPPAGSTACRLVIERKSTTYASGDVVDVATFAQSAASRGNPLAPQSFIQFLTGYYYLENKTIYSLSSTTFTEVYTFEDLITGVEVYGANLIVSVGTGDYYYYSADGTTWTRTATASYKMIQLKAISDDLYGTDTASSFKTASDPIAGAWSSNTQVGNTSSSITDLADYNATAFIGKSDNLYYLNTSGVPQAVAPDFRGLVSSYNCLGLRAWGGVLWIPLNNGLYRYSYPSYNDLKNVSPSVYASYFTDYHGRVHALAGDLDWLYIATSSSTATSSKTPIMACRYETIEDVEVNTDVRFHTLLNIDLDNVYAMDVYSTKLWVAGLKSTTAYIRYLSLAGDDYPTSGTLTLTTCYYDSNFPSFYKSYHSFELQSNNLTANIKVTVEFQIDGGTWTELAGTGQGSFTSSTAPQVKYFQASTYGRKIRFRFTLVTNAAGTTPEITGFIVRGALRPDTLRVQEWWIDCGDNVPLMDGRPDSQMASGILSSLNTAKGQTWALTIYDPWGTSMRGFIKSPTPEISGYTIDEKKRIHTTIHLTLQEARLS